MAKHYHVYILTNPTYTTLYIGVTSDIERRLSEHRGGALTGFAARYNLARLVHLEDFSDVQQAINREKQIKGWTRARKIDLIEADNPGWHDLAEGWCAPPQPQILRASE